MALDGKTNERLFAESVKAGRELKKWTQTDLARAMKERGFPFHQQTVQRIEDGERAIKLDEAFALAEILGRSVDEMRRSTRTGRAVSAYNAMAGGFTIQSHLMRVGPEWAKDCDRVLGHVEFDLERSPKGPSTWAGIEILRRMVEAVDAAEAWGFAQSKAAGYNEAFDHVRARLGQPLDEDDEDEPEDPDADRSDLEREARNIVRTHKVPPRFRKMPLVEVVDLFIARDDL